MMERPRLKRPKHSFGNQVDGNPQGRARAKQGTEDTQIFNRREWLMRVGH